MDKVLDSVMGKIKLSLDDVNPVRAYLSHKEKQTLKRWETISCSVKEEENNSHKGIVGSIKVTEEEINNMDCELVNPPPTPLTNMASNKTVTSVKPLGTVLEDEELTNGTQLSKSNSNFFTALNKLAAMCVLPHDRPLNLYEIDEIRDQRVSAQRRDAAIAELCHVNCEIFKQTLELFLETVHLIDTFLMRVRVKPRYMECVTAAAYSMILKKKTGDATLIASCEQLLFFSKCKGTAQDMKQMVEIIKKKLKITTDEAFDLFLATSPVPLLQSYKIMVNNKEFRQRFLSSQRRRNSRLSGALMKKVYHQARNILTCAYSSMIVYRYGVIVPVLSAWCLAIGYNGIKTKDNFLECLAYFCQINQVQIFNCMRAIAFTLQTGQRPRIVSNIQCEAICPEKADGQKLAEFRKELSWSLSSRTRCAIERSLRILRKLPCIPE